MSDDQRVSGAPLFDSAGEEDGPARQVDDSLRDIEILCEGKHQAHEVFEQLRPSVYRNYVHRNVAALGAWRRKTCCWH